MAEESIRLEAGPVSDELRDAKGCEDCLSSPAVKKLVVARVEEAKGAG